ncbi:MAG: hypothetical protein HUJ63_05015 [Enterococcus sp.]|nr:hypothetical protein [Enterococcus sp.]
MNDPNERLLLTGDGHPIGELVVSDGGSLQMPGPDPEESRTEALRAQASELLGEPDADKAIAELYDGFGDTRKRERARDLFVKDQMPIGKVAEEVGVPERTVSEWAYLGKWLDLVERELDVRQKASRLELARIRSARRAAVAREQLDAAKAVRDAATEQLASGEVSVRAAAEALKSAADVEARILGIKETGETAETAEKAPAGAGKVPLVVMFNGGLPPQRGGAVDV